MKRNFNVTNGSSHTYEMMREDVELGYCRHVFAEELPGNSDDDLGEPLEPPVGWTAQVVPQFMGTTLVEHLCVTCGGILSTPDPDQHRCPILNHDEAANSSRVISHGALNDEIS